jgi:hypothetical protein
MSGMLYNSHDGTSSQTPNYDFKELAMILPSIGNAISSVWDIIYGGVDTAENGYRHLELEWEDASKAQKRAGLRLVNKITGGHGYSYDDNRVNTVAGCINSVHDLMGMIIVDKDTEDAYTLDADGLDGEKIYFFDKNNGYFYKKKYYDYYRIAYMYKEIALTAETYIPNMYYVATVANPNSYSSGDFTADTETAFDPSKTYYAKYSSDRNEEYTVVNVQEYTPGAYYKTDGGDYIYDEKESAQENIEYYNGDESQISEIKITNNYEPSYYYYWNDSTKTYVLDTSLSVTSGRNYYVINEGENQLQTCYLRDSQNYDETSGLYYCGQDEND